MSLEVFGDEGDMGPEGYVTDEVYEEAQAEIEQLQALLKEHHDWHLAQGDVSAPDGKGGHFTWDASDAYGDSDLCNRTHNALPYLPPKCGTCGGHGLVGGFVNTDNGYQGDPCPDCSPASPERSCDTCGHGESTFCDGCSEYGGFKNWSGGGDS